jgi:hypothetical protein
MAGRALRGRARCAEPGVRRGGGGHRGAIPGARRRLALAGGPARPLRAASGHPGLSRAPGHRRRRGGYARTHLRERGRSGAVATYVGSDQGRVHARRGAHEGRLLDPETGSRRPGQRGGHGARDWPGARLCRDGHGALPADSFLPGRVAGEGHHGGGGSRSRARHRPLALPLSRQPIPAHARADRSAQQREHGVSAPRPRDLEQPVLRAAGGSRSRGTAPARRPRPLRLAELAGARPPGGSRRGR